MRHSKHVGRATVLFVMVMLLAGCSGETLPATNIGRQLVTLNARGSCDGVKDKPCYYQFRVEGPDRTYFGLVHGPVTVKTNGLVPISDEWYLAPGTRYTYRFCGKGDNNVPNWTCASPVTFTMKP